MIHPIQFYHPKAIGTEKIIGERLVLLGNLREERGQATTDPGNVIF
jgi:hypothetical protein